MVAGSRTEAVTLEEACKDSKAIGVVGCEIMYHVCYSNTVCLHKSGLHSSFGLASINCVVSTMALPSSRNSMTASLEWKLHTPLTRR